MPKSKKKAQFNKWIDAKIIRDFERACEAIGSNSLAEVSKFMKGFSAEHGFGTKKRGPHPLPKGKSGKGRIGFMKANPIILRLVG